MTGRVLYFLFALTFISVNPARAQVFGGHPPSVHWRQLNTAYARIIYPTGLDSLAMSVANGTSLVPQMPVYSLGNKFQKISVVLRSRTTVANAYVALGPYRSEFYTTPEQNSFDLGSQRWLTQLSVHEFRHVQQYSNFNVGLSRLIGAVLGEQGRDFANTVAVPDWFFEGDAVFNESYLSGQGRGRLPYFFNAYRSLWEDKRNYSWMKLRNGSLRDFVPGHYELGYLLVAYGRERYGSTFWGSVTHDAAAYKSLLYPFQHAIKKYAGVRYPKFRTEALAQARSRWQQDTAKVSMQSPQHFLGDETNPVFGEAGQLFFATSSYKKIPAFMVKTKDATAKIRTISVTLDNYFSYRKGRIVYSAYRPDIRWGFTDFSEVHILNTDDGSETVLPKSQKDFAPDIAPSGKALIVVHTGEKGDNHLQLKDWNGKVLTDIPAPRDAYFTYPKFLNEQQVVSALRDREGKMSLALTDLSKGQTSILIAPSSLVIGFPDVHGDTIFFSASYMGHDVLMAYDLPARQLFRVTHVNMRDETGYYQPAINSAELVLSHFTSAGYRLQSYPLAELTWTKISLSSVPEKATDFGLKSLDLKTPVKYDSRIDSAKKYASLHRLFNLHSWLPLINDPEYSISVVGENVLNTMETEIHGTYNRNEQSKLIGVQATYGGLFPYIHAGFDYTFDRRGTYHNQVVRYSESELRAGLEVPLNLSRNRSFTNLSFGSDLVYNQRYFPAPFKDSIRHDPFVYSDNFISFNHQIQKARQQIYPHFAQSVYLNYKAAISKYSGNQFLASGNFYLPGFSGNHSLVINLAYHHRDTLSQVSFSNNFPFSRGYSAFNFPEMLRAGFNYHLPIAYPDWGFGQIVYFLRVRANFFADESRIKYYNGGGGFHADFKSAGTEIFFDTRWWNQLPVSFGFRYAHLFDPNPGVPRSDYFEFILPINLINR